MKIKKMLTLFIMQIIVFSSFSLISANRIKNDDLDSFLNQTPSHYSSISIYYYLNNQASKYEHRGLNLDGIKTKTTIFNSAFQKYIKEVYNNEYYSNFISQDGSHIIEFLKLSKELNLETINLYTCLRLFNNKIKSCEIIDDTVALQILKPLPILIEQHFAPASKNNLKYLKKSIEKTIIYKFTDHIKEFQEKPNIFISKLSKEITNLARKEMHETKSEKEKLESKERFRSLLIRLLENLLNKVVWNFKYFESIWSSVLEIANGIINLSEYRAIDHMDDIDDLLWSLTHRFTYFLNISGAYLPSSFYEEIESDIASGAAFFLELDEQDPGIKTKKEVILHSLVNAKTKAIAFERKGIFSDQTI